MTIQNSITTLVESLTNLASISHGTTEAANRIAKSKAQTLVRESDLEQDTIKSICTVIAKDSNPSGWYYDGNGINAGIAALEELTQTEAVEDNAVIESVETSVALNRANLKNLVSNATTLVVKLIKRTTEKLTSALYRFSGRSSNNDKGLIAEPNMNTKDSIQTRWRAHRARQVMSRPSMLRGV